MELGKILLRRNGINALTGAIHPKYGLAWTDGRGIFLVPVNIIDDEVEYEGSIKLGEFEFVQSLHWSCDAGGFCYLCVVHENSISLWKVNGTNPELHFKQVRKINVNPIPQGVLWNPNRDILCVLCRDQCSFYFRHIQSKGSFALPPIESGRISAGCWSEDGEKFIMGIGSIILIYQWMDIDRSISEYTIIAWKIPNVEGRICATIAVNASRVICTAELPLETLCHNSQQNMFAIPDIQQNGIEENNLNKDESNERIVRPNKDSTTSLKDNIMNLQRSQSSMQDSSLLILFEIQGRAMEPAKLASIHIKGVISPELLYYDHLSNHVVVGCNTQNTLQVFQIHETDVFKVHEIHLAQNERPKGLCGVMQRCRPLSEGILALIGRTSAPDSAFLPASIRAQYDMKLRFLNLLPGYNHDGVKHGSHTSEGSFPGNFFKELQLPSGNARVHLLRINPIKTDRKAKDCLKRDKESDKIKKSGETSPLRELKLPTDSKKNAKAKIMVLDGSECSSENLSHEQVDFSDVSSNFCEENQLISDKKYLNQETLNIAESLPNYKSKISLKNLLGAPNELGVNGELNGNSRTYGLDTNSAHTVGVTHCETTMKGNSSEMQQHVSKLEAQVKTQASQIVLLQERIEQIANLLEDSTCVPSTKYRPADSPEVVNLIWQSDDLSTKISKSFILDNGRLQLEPVKQAFNLMSVELILDGMACVLGANVDGYIPIKFKPNTTMYLTGKRASPRAERRGSPKTKH